MRDLLSVRFTMPEYKRRQYRLTSIGANPKYVKVIRIASGLSGPAKISH
jgi:hypothetical protein